MCQYIQTESHLSKNGRYQPCYQPCTPAQPASFFSLPAEAMEIIGGQGRRHPLPLPVVSHFAISPAYLEAMAAQRQRQQLEFLPTTPHDSPAGKGGGMMSSPLSSLSSPGSCDYSGPATTCHYETRLNNKHSSTLLATLGKKNPLFEEHEGQQRTEGVPNLRSTETK